MTDDFSCRQCGACCRLPGHVRLDEKSISAIAEFLGITEREFIHDYTKLRRDRRGLVLKEKRGVECIFLEDNRCIIHPVKPPQCIGFPREWNFPGFEKICKAAAAGACHS
ncbi:MAG: YkgJ family cysteine cluster protein [Verrucomicrobia bacterium]|nr:YkgJ family cysteine cluster protein [Verrucomicrobiota bacterium]MCF7708643.1 YkgJ family cysteine cluster protein [Verrucomicrobiota bacterium]